MTYSSNIAYNIETSISKSVDLTLNMPTIFTFIVTLTTQSVDP